MPETAHVPMFSALHELNYRRYFAGQVISNTGTWMQRIAQDWLVLELTDSQFAVGVTMALQFAPVLMFGLWGGLIVDRFSKHAILMTTQALMGLQAAALAAATLSGIVNVWHVYLAACALGLVTVVDNPARQVFVNELVAPGLVRNAVSLNTATFQLARLVGPAVAGLLIAAIGSGWVFAINAASFIATILALLSMNKAQLLWTPSTALSASGQVREGLRYIADRPYVLWVIVTVFFIGAFAYNFPVFLSAYAKNEFDAGASVYGLLNTALAVGSVAGAMLAARRAVARLGFLFGVAGTFSLLMILLGLVPWIPVFVVVLAICGLASTTFNTTANASVQLATAARIRGRVMSIYVMVFLGGKPLGGPLAGEITDRWGAPIGLMIAGGVCLVAALVCALLAARQAKVRLRFDLRPRAERHLITVYRERR